MGGGIMRMQRGFQLTSIAAGLLVPAPGQAAGEASVATITVHSVANKTIRALLGKFGIAHAGSLYDGEHTNRVPQRLRENMLPFFAKHLARK